MQIHVYIDRRFVRVFRGGMLLGLFLALSGLAEQRRTRSTAFPTSSVTRGMLPIRTAWTWTEAMMCASACTEFRATAARCGPNAGRAPTIPFTAGLFNVLLGQVAPLPDPFPGDPSYLGGSMGSDPEMTVRERLASVPVALMVADGGARSQGMRLQYATVQQGYSVTSSKALVYVTGSQLSVTTDAASVLLVSFFGSLFSTLNANQAAGGLLTISVDGTDRTDLVTQEVFAWSGSVGAPNPAIAPVGFVVPDTVGAGAHTVKPRVHSSSYDSNYRNAGLGRNNRNSTFSVMVFRQ